jgi:transposase
MFVLEAKLRGSTRQFAIIDEMIRTAGFVRNSCIRHWMDNRGVGQYDLSALCSVLAKEYEWAKKLNSQARQASAERAWQSIKRFYDNCKNPAIKKKGYPKFKKARPVIQPQITALPEQPTSPPSTKPTSPPTIQVTIGRIDVRAIAAPTPSRRPSTPSPAKLSLDEYLRSRSSGASRKGGGS